jgi:dienelactone hydrolase
VLVQVFGRRLMVAVMGIVAMAGLTMPVASVQAAAPPPLSAYGRLPGLERVSISPSGNRLAMVGEVDGARRLIVVDQDKKPLLALPLKDEKIRGLYWAGEDRVLVYKSDAQAIFGYTQDKAELYSMVVVPLDGQPLWAVFGKYPKIMGGVQGFAGIQEREGKTYGYFAGSAYGNDSKDTARACSRPVLYEVDLQTQQAREISSCFMGGVRDWVMAPGGKVGATLDFSSLAGKWLVRNSDGQTIAQGTNPLGDIGLVGLGPTPDTVIYSETLKDDETRWFELPLAGGTPREMLAGAAVDRAYFDERTRRLAGYRTDGDVPSYTFFDPFRQKVINAAVKAFPGVSVQLKDWNERFDRLVVMTEGAADPQTWWMIDIRTGKATEIGSSYLIDPADVAPVQTIRYKASDGLEIPAVLTLPPGRPARNLPVVVLPHGGPAGRDYPGFDWWAQAVASRGYAVLQPNFRGSTGYGNDFERAGHGEWGRKMQTDLSDGLAWLAAQGIADPRRACIMGASYGGYAALAGVTLQSGLYRCAISVAGVSDPAKRFVDIGGSGENLTTRRSMKDYFGDYKGLRAVSPISLAAQASAPILLIHGKDDTVVKYEQSNDMAAALRLAGKPVEFVTLPAEDHFLSRSETRLAMLEAAMAFIVKYNPPDPLP